MTLLVIIVAVFGGLIGFFAAWHWQRIKYERILRIIARKDTDIKAG